MPETPIVIYNRAIGIDLGFTHCVAAYLSASERAPHPVRGSWGEEGVPLAMHLPDGLCAIPPLAKAGESCDDAAWLWLGALLSGEFSLPPAQTGFWQGYTSLFRLLREGAAQEFKPPLRQSKTVIDRAVIALPKPLPDELRSWLQASAREAGFRSVSFLTAVEAAALFTLWRHGLTSGKLLVASLDYELQLGLVSVDESGAHLVHEETVPFLAPLLQHSRPTRDEAAGNASESRTSIAVMTVDGSPQPPPVVEQAASCRPSALYSMLEELKQLWNKNQDEPEAPDDDSAAAQLRQRVANRIAILYAHCYRILAEDPNVDAVVLSGKGWEAIPPWLSQSFNSHAIHPAISADPRYPVIRVPGFNAAFGAAIAAANLGMVITAPGFRLAWPQSQPFSGPDQSLVGAVCRPDGAALASGGLMVKVGAKALDGKPVTDGQFSIATSELDSGENKIQFSLEGGKRDLPVLRSFFLDPRPSASLSRLYDRTALKRLAETVAGYSPTGPSAEWLLASLKVQVSCGGAPIFLPIIDQAQKIPFSATVALGAAVLQQQAGPRNVWLRLWRDDAPLVGECIALPTARQQTVSWLRLEMTRSEALRISVLLDEQPVWDRDIELLHDNSRMTAENLPEALSEISAMLPEASLASRETAAIELKALAGASALTDGEYYWILHRIGVLHRRLATGAAAVPSKIAAVTSSAQNLLQQMRHLGRLHIEQVQQELEAFSVHAGLGTVTEQCYEIWAAKELGLIPAIGAASERGAVFSHRLHVLLYGADESLPFIDAAARAQMQALFKRAYLEFQQQPAKALAIFIAIANFFANAGAESEGKRFSLPALFAAE